MPNLQGYIFYSLQHFTTKLRNFSKRGMLFQAMVIFLPNSIFFKILSERGKVHYDAIKNSKRNPDVFGILFFKGGPGHQSGKQRNCQSN